MHRPELTRASDPYDLTHCATRALRYWLQRRLAQVERKLVENRDRNELTHFRAMHTHERAAEIHDALADFYPDVDD